MTEVAKSVDALRNQIAAADERVDRRFTGLENRIAAFEERVDRKFDALDSKLSRLFTWLVGLFMATMVTIVGTFLAR